MIKYSQPQQQLLSSFLYLTRGNHIFPPSFSQVSRLQQSSKEKPENELLHLRNQLVCSAAHNILSDAMIARKRLTFQKFVAVLSQAVTATSITGDCCRRWANWRRYIMRYMLLIKSTFWATCSTSSATVMDHIRTSGAPKTRLNHQIQTDEKSRRQCSLLLPKNPLNNSDAI